jgi:hypothetical protein
MIGAPINGAACAERGLSQEPRKKAARLAFVSSRACRSRDGCINEATSIQRSMTSTNSDIRSCLEQPPGVMLGTTRGGRSDKPPHDLTLRRLH